MFRGSIFIITFLVLTRADGEFRRIDSSGNTITIGRQEGLLLYNGGTVCVDHFNITAAHAICKEMGFGGALEWKFGLKWTIQNAFSILLDDVRCRLPYWSSCSYSNTQKCDHRKDVFVTCLPRVESVFQLVDSSGNYITSGEQEGLLLHNEGTVASNHFNSTAAHAICKVMGFTGALQCKWTSGLKWQIQTTYSVLTDTVMCSLADWSTCNHSDSHYLGHDRDVFMTCSGSRSSFSLVDKRGYTVSGSQEFLLLYNGGTVCGDQFSNNSADAACRDMGYSGAESWRVAMSWGDYRIALDDMNCTAGEWKTCGYTTSHNCVHGKDIYISCKSRQDSSSSSKSVDRRGEEEKLEAGENLAIAILILACTVLVFLLVKKNSQIDQKDLQIDQKDLQIDQKDLQIAQKDLQIAQLLKKLENIDYSEETLTEPKLIE